MRVGIEACNPSVWIIACNSEINDQIYHVRGETYFWELDDVGAPNYGIGYFSLFVLTLIPALFRRFVRTRLDDWDNNQATQEEIAIANQFKAMGIIS